MTRRFHTLDVFTETRFTGNPLAVVLEAEGLTDTQMQTIAREFNLSETLFVFPPDNPAHWAKVRIFTPTKELPFAGHPMVGAGALLAAQKLGPVTERREAIVVLEAQIGPVRIGVSLTPDAPPFAEFDLPQMPQAKEDVPSRDDLSLLFGLATGEIGFENHEPSRFSAGVDFLFVPVRNLRVLESVLLNAAAWHSILGDEPSGAYLYCRETMRADSAFHARMFAPLLGVTEDPATGSAAAAFAGVIARFDQPVAGTHAYVIEQGYEMGRPSHISLELVMDGGLHAVRIGGHAVSVSEGVLEV